MATKLSLTLTCGDYEITRPLAEGQVEPDGIALTVLTNTASRDRHWRLARNAECDLGEFNACAYFMARERGHPYIALPIYPHRRFRHGSCSSTPPRASRKPDLRGPDRLLRRFSARGGVWLRGLLENSSACRIAGDLGGAGARRNSFHVAAGAQDRNLSPGKSLDEMLARARSMR